MPLLRQRWLAAVAWLPVFGCFTEPTAGTGTDASASASSGDVDPDTGSSGETNPPPTGGGCLGCLDAAGGCLAGNLDQACGALAQPCSVCDADAYCKEGTCEPLPACTPENCDGCCDGDECLRGDDVAACGAGGGECSACMGSSICIEGSCALPCADNCDGCCDASGDCIPLDDTDDAACGQQGAACSQCDGDSQCESGMCISTACAMKCDGCCAGDDCMSGDTPNSCGESGAACFSCPGGTLCDQSCIPDPEASWDLLIESAQLPELNPNGGNWDTFGLPDPYFELTMGEDSFRTETIDGTFLPVWSELVVEGVSTQRMMETAEYAIYDDDSPAGRDLAGVCVFAFEPEAFGVPVSVACTDEDGDVLWSLQMMAVVSPP